MRKKLKDLSSQQYENFNQETKRKSIVIFKAIFRAVKRVYEIIHLSQKTKYINIAIIRHHHRYRIKKITFVLTHSHQETIIKRRL